MNLRLFKKLYEIECTTYECPDNTNNNNFNNNFNTGHGIKKRSTCTSCYEIVKERGCANICQTGKLRITAGHRVVCCQSDYCNSSSKLLKSIFLSFGSVIFIIYTI